jgi:hypothetical protein
VAITPEEERRKCCVDGPLITELIGNRIIIIRITDIEPRLLKQLSYWSVKWSYSYDSRSATHFNSEER